MSGERKGGSWAAVGLVAAGLAAVAAWSVLGPPEPAATPATATATATARPAAAPLGTERPSAAALDVPARQWKVGDSFVYEIDNTRQVTLTQAPSPTVPN